MRAQSQKDNRWKNEKLGTCNDTIGASGCFITALSNLADKTPSEVNKLFKEKGGYSNGCMVNSDKAKEILGLQYFGKSTLIDPMFVCIAETDHYKKQGVPQHFFNIRKDGKIIDPLDLKPYWKKNKYNIVSLRNFRAKDEELEKPEEPKIEPEIIEKPVEQPLPPPPVETPPEPISEPTEAPVANQLTLTNMEKILNFFKTKQVKTFGWNMLGTFLGILAIYLTDIQSEYAVILIPVILAATKFINKNYLTK
ncbi:MAG: hypothetical protein ABIK92_04590 [Pseudomonadota bacterium]